MYIPLKVTTDYTLLKSLIKVDDLIKFLCDKKITACGICDENLYGIFEFYFKCKNNNIKPIIGLNIIIDNLDIYLYPTNYEGLKKLFKIHSKKELGIIEVSDIINIDSSIIVIIPYKSRILYKRLCNVSKVYISYSNSYEKINSLVLTSNVVYIKDIRSICKGDLEYIKYLDMIRKDNIEVKGEYFSEDVIDTGCLNDIVDAINIEIPINTRYIPSIKDKDLVKLCNMGLYKRCKGNVSKVYQNRLNYELDVINKMGFTDYFLIVYDYVLFAKKNGIMVGPGRGSAAGSLVSYSIGITDIDPIKYNLMFERFLNEYRVTMPDIDIDFDALRKEEVIEYVRDKYGSKNVALGLTFSTFKSKLVLREIGKLLGIQTNLLDSFIKVIDGNLSLKDNLSNEVVKKYISNYDIIKKLYKISIHLENLKRNTSTHAAGVIISSKNLEEIIPIHYDNNTLITGCTMDYLEDLGLLKMDFLAVKNLTMVSNIVKKINIDLNSIRLDDPVVYKLFSDGNTDGIFQFETPLLKSLCMRLKPKCFNDLVALLALGRPGALKMADSYIRRSKREEKIDYIDDSIKYILEETFGIILYQEQIMEILKVVGGYDLASADIIRRAISKKKDDVIQSQRDKFINKAINNGYSKEVVNKIYDLIVMFASYGFNKSHSVSYATFAYQMAYLKVKYPQYFIIEMINNKTSDRKNSNINYLKQNGYKIRRPDINVSKNDYYILDMEVIMPLSVIRGISKEIEQIILDRRSNRGYSDIFDFAYVNKDILNKDIFTLLIKSGLFDSMNINRHTLIDNIDVILNYVNLSDGSNLIKRPLLMEVSEYSDDELRNMDIEVLGSIVSNHPASKYKNVVKLENINNYLFKNINCIVLIDRINKIKTKKNEDMAFISGSDDTASIEFVVFPRSMEVMRDVNVNDLVQVRGKVSKSYDKVNIVVNSIMKVK